MSESFTKVLVKDSRIANITDSIKYAVVKGAMSVNPRHYPTSSTNSINSQVFTIQTPSEATLISRKVLWNAQIVLQISGTVPAGGTLLNWGVTESLGPFPLNNMCSNMQATLNNTTISVNMRDVFPSLMRANDKRVLSRMNGTAPTMFDTYAYYPDGVNANNSPFLDYSSVSDNDIMGRGAYPVVIANAYDSGTGVLSGAPNIVNTTGGALVKSCYISVTISEPLLFSPFIFGDPVNDCAMYGITNMLFNFSIADASRFIRSATWNVVTDPVNLNPTGVTCVLAASGIRSSQLLIEYLTVHASDLLSSKNIVPYMSYARYVSQNLNQQAAASLSAIPYALGGVQTQTTNTFQLSNIPDMIAVSFRKPQGGLTNSDPDWALVINQININFNNMNGLLSGALPQDLWRYSIESSNNQSWLEFSGVGMKANNATNVGQPIALSGGFLFLEFGKHIQLTEDYYAPGSLGSFSLQITAQVQNQNNAAVTPECCIITFSSGILVNDRGVTNSYLGLLSKSDVLEASGMECYSGKDVDRMLGGGWLDKIKSLGKLALPHLPGIAKAARGALESSSNPYAKKANDALKSVGLGMSGGSRMSGGSKRRMQDYLLRDN